MNENDACAYFVINPRMDTLTAFIESAKILQEHYFKWKFRKYLKILSHSMAYLASKVYLNDCLFIPQDHICIQPKAAAWAE